MSPDELIEKLRPLGPAFRQANELMNVFGRMSEEDQMKVVTGGLADYETTHVLGCQQLIIEFIQKHRDEHGYLKNTNKEN